MQIYLKAIKPPESMINPVATHGYAINLDPPLSSERVDQIPHCNIVAKFLL